MPPKMPFDNGGPRNRAPHVVRPHHIALLMVMMGLFKELQGRLSMEFVLHAYRFLLREVSEVSQPLSFDELVTELSSGSPKGDPAAKAFIQLMSGTFTDLVNVEQISQFFTGIVDLFIIKPDDSSPFTRRSLFGYFGRRCLVTFVKLSFAGAVKLQQDYHKWRHGDVTAGYDPVRPDSFDDDTVLLKTKQDKDARVQTEPLELFEEHFATGDEITAADSLRAFFEQHFHDSKDTGYRQHALLQHSRLHYLREEYAEARRLLHEAVSLCRVKNDKTTLMHCMALLHRLPPIEHGQKPILNEIQPELHPSEVLFDIVKLLDEQADQPLSVVFKRIVEAVGLYDHYVEAQGHQTMPSEQWSQHAVQSAVWRTAGRSRLAAVERDIVTAFTEVGGSNYDRLAITFARAYGCARQGHYDHGLAMLLDPNIWRGIALVKYPAWASQVWHILVLRSSRLGMKRQFREVLLRRRPLPVFRAGEYWPLNMPTRANVGTQLMRDVMHMRKYDQAPAAVEQLLSALWKSEFQCRYGLYRTGMILLADVGLEFGMSKKCRQIMEEIMPQIRAGQDGEQKALAYFTHARCIIASGEQSRKSLQEAVPWLRESEAEYNKLSMHVAVADVQYLLATVYHNLGAFSERDESSKRHLHSEELAAKAETVVIEEEVMQVWRLVTEVGAALSAR